MEQIYALSSTIRWNTMKYGLFVARQPSMMIARLLLDYTLYRRAVQKAGKVYNFQCGSLSNGVLNCLVSF